eukprot:8953476-Pyramimonas_sp.AAC.1
MAYMRNENSKGKKTAPIYSNEFDTSTIEGEVRALFGDEWVRVESMTPDDLAEVQKVKASGTGRVPPVSEGMTPDGKKK